MIYFYCITGKDQIDKAHYLNESLKKFGYTLTIIPEYDNELKNLSKIIKIGKYLENIIFDDKDVIVLMDAFDVLCCTDPIVLLDYLNKKNVDIVISTEKKFGRHPIITKKYFDKYNRLNHTYLRYICAGFYFGRANKIKEFLTGMINQFDEIKNSMNIMFKNNDPSYLTSDQCFMSLYLYNINFITYEKLKIILDVHDDIILTSDPSIKKFDINKYVFIHIWALGMTIQKNKYDETCKQLGLI